MESRAKIPGHPIHPMLMDIRRCFGIAVLAALLASCTYGKMLRPSVLKQLNPDVVRLVNELPEVDSQNEALIGRLFVHGGLSHADTGEDGVMRDAIHVPSGEGIWKPAIIVMEQPGELELQFTNMDEFSHHAALLPSQGGRQFLNLPMHASGKARIRLNSPGYYWFGCPVGNHAGRGMLGLILVKGEVPDEAKLDRPPQQQPN